MTLNEVLKQLDEFGNESTKKTLAKHGAKEPFFGVRVADLKKILKKTKKNHELSIELFNTGNSDAMYLAGLMADENKITKEQLEDWVNKAYWYYLSEYAVPWVAAETPYALELALKWIDSKEENVAAAGWSTLSSYASINKDEDIDLNLYKELLERVKNEIHQSANRVKYTMNNFVIATGTFISPLTKESTEIAKSIGIVSVDMNGTACKVPLATDYLDKVIKMGRVGKKKKTARC